MFYITYDDLADTNECDIGNSGCEQICTNQIPFYSCSCNHGYRLHNEKFCSGMFNDDLIHS